jgi:hypothetical protein
VRWRDLERDPRLPSAQPLLHAAVTPMTLAFYDVPAGATGIAR